LRFRFFVGDNGHQLVAVSVPTRQPTHLQVLLQCAAMAEDATQPGGAVALAAVEEVPQRNDETETAVGQRNGISADAPVVERRHVIDVARKTCSRRRPSTLWTGFSAAWQ